MSLIWFRGDLRLLDNTAFEKAQRLGEPLLAVFIHTPQQWRKHDVAEQRIAFIKRNVALLKQSLVARKIEFIEYSVDSFDEVPEVLLALLLSRQINTVFANREYGVYEINRDKSCAELFREHGIVFRLPHDQAIVAPGKVLTKSGTPYTVFTPFYKTWLRHLPQAVAVNAPEPYIDQDQHWPAGEYEAMRRLVNFIESRISGYQLERDIPSLDATSGLSAWLAAGVISPRVCLQLAADANQGIASGGNEGIHTWIKELAWRDFYIHILFHFPRVSMGKPFKRNTDAITWRNSEADFIAWCNGSTGIPIIDAAMRQLVQTGWMHNRLRMVAAMFLSKHLLIDWRKGEAFFMKHLVDGHLASNNGGWQWAASTGTDTVPYFRVFSPVRQSERFDPEGLFIKRFLPELSEVPAKEIHDLKPMSRRMYAPDYPEPIVDLALGRDRAIDTFKQLKKEE